MSTVARATIILLSRVQFRYEVTPVRNRHEMITLRIHSTGFSVNRGGNYGAVFQILSFLNMYCFSMGANELTRQLVSSGPPFAALKT